MAQLDPKIQMRLIRDLEPAVAIEIESHIRTTRIGTLMSMFLGQRGAPLLAHLMEMHGRQRIRS